MRVLGISGTPAGRRPLTAAAVVVLLGLLLTPAPLQSAGPVATPPPRGPEIFGPAGTVDEMSAGGPSAGAGGPAMAAADVQSVVPSGFSDTVAFSGLNNPTAIEFAADGRVFVAEKRGRVLQFDSLADPTPSTWVAFETNVHNYWDRGLLGMALDPNFTSNGRIYVLYTYNHILGDGAASPRWPDSCPGPLSMPPGPGGTTDGCVVSGRLSRFTNGGGETVLVEDWCQQFPSHSIGALAFGADGALYASGGDGASFNGADHGQSGGTIGPPYTPANPCGDPPSGVGTALSRPTAEGGALRSQDIRTSGDPATLDGTIIRIDPSTGAALPTNPAFGSGDANVRRIIASGLRNPFRITFRPGTNDLWLGDVGWDTIEEINRIPTPTASVRNFGWPCYEGGSPEPSYELPVINICDPLYDTPSLVTQAYYTYNHAAHVVPGDACPPGGTIPGSVISGLEFYPTSGGSFPSTYNGTLFFGDTIRRCIWAMKAGGGGLPDIGQITTFASGLGSPTNPGDPSGPVDLEVGPDGALYWVNFHNGEIRRIAYQAPTAVIDADPTSGAVPLQVDFDGTGSTIGGPGLGPLTYAWDLDADGQFDDSTSATPSWMYNSIGTFHPALRVTDNQGVFDTSSVTIDAGNSPPVPFITTPQSSLTWHVGESIPFAGGATDAQDPGGMVSGSGLDWTLYVHHCPDTCHTHEVETAGGPSGSFSAPDHEYPSHLELRLVATDSNGASAETSVLLDPESVDVTFASSPPGVTITGGDRTQPAPFGSTFIVGSAVHVSAPATATVNGHLYYFLGWSDGGAAAHTISAPAVDTTFTAIYEDAGSSYVAFAPKRVLDTRIGLGLPNTFKANVPRTWQMSGRNGIPANAVAVTGNVTVVDQTKAGFVSVTTSPIANPATSTVNVPLGDVRANGVTVALDPSGKLSAVFKATSGSTHLVFDVTGYFVPDETGATFQPMAPVRLLDTRNGTGGYSTPFVSGTPRAIQVTGQGGIPGNAVAISANLTVTDQTAAGYASVTKDPIALPPVSTLNFPLGDDRANGLTIGVNGNGRVSLVYRGATAGSTANLLFDVTGYYVAGTGGLRFHALSPQRILDTRTGLGLSGTFKAHTPRTLAVAGTGVIPDDVEAITGNVTVVGQTKAGFISVTTTPLANPTTSTMNMPVGDIRANNFVIDLSGPGNLSATYGAVSGASTQLVMDVSGYFR